MSQQNSIRKALTSTDQVGVEALAIGTDTHEAVQSEVLEHDRLRSAKSHDNKNCVPNKPVKQVDKMRVVGVRALFDRNCL